MKANIILLIAILTTACLNAQENQEIKKTVFRKSYIKLGFDKLGVDLDNNLSPIENVKAGSYGASTGYVLDFGHIFYFRNRDKNYKINFGLDWTILSLGYAKLDKWEAYAASQSPDASIDEPAMSAALATKLGPVIAYNPVDKLVIEGRFQVAYMVRRNELSYYDYNEDEDKSSYFSINNETIKPGIATSVGITLRYGFIGFAVDYISAKHNTAYEAKEPFEPSYTAEEKIHSHDLQVKVSFTF